MTIEKAIEILRQDLGEYLICYPKEIRQAKELGIEALKRLKEHREDHIDITFRSLPGETKDESET